MFLSYSTFISKLNNYKILYISQLGFKSKKEEDQFIKIIDNNYFKNWHKKYVHTSLLYKYKQKYYSTPVMFVPLKKSPLQIPDISYIIQKNDLKLLNKNYYENHKPLVKDIQETDNVNINTALLHNIYLYNWEIFLWEYKFGIAKKYYEGFGTSKKYANCQINIRDILFCITNKIIYPPRGTTLLGYNK